MRDSDRTIEIHASGERIVFLKSTSDTAGAFLELEVTMKGGGPGPPLHIHRRQTEEFEVLAGVAGFQIGRERMEAGVGTRRTVPPGMPHTWWNAGAAELRLHAELRPALGTEAMLRAVFASANRRGSTMPDLFEGARLMMRVRDEYRLMRPPAPVQNVVFPMAVLLGQLIGKYSSDSV